MPLPEMPRRMGEKLADGTFRDASQRPDDSADTTASESAPAKRASRTADQPGDRPATAKKSGQAATSGTPAKAVKKSAKAAKAAKTSSPSEAAAKDAAVSAGRPSRDKGVSGRPAPAQDTHADGPRAAEAAAEDTTDSGTPAGKTTDPGTQAKRTPPREGPPPSGAAARKLPAAKRAAQQQVAGSADVRKLFVLDTNVLLHDSNCIFRFQEHDIFLPMIVLEELDHQKKGVSEVARNARQVSRYLEGLASAGERLEAGVPLDGLGNIEARGRLFIQTRPLSADLPVKLPMGKADNAILGVVHAVRDAWPERSVVLVSKDINMRLKARALGLTTEDYLNDHVLDDSDLLYDGVLTLPDNFWTRHGKDIESWQQGGITYYRIRGPLCSQFMVNQFVYSENGMPLYAQVKEAGNKSAVLATVRDYSHGKNNVWGITARNQEQNFAFNLLMNPDCDFVSLLGQAGTGKTLLALASGLTQTLETRRYNEIIITRATVPVGDDIGYLPGTEEEKMLPWMGALEDNLEVLHLGMAGKGTMAGTASDPARNATMELVRSRIKVKSMSFMRGRTFLNKFLIIDEAQNLTPKQMKTLITRAGPGTKIVCLGNIAQIDTPYLTEGSSGLTYVVDRFKGWPHAGHITLQRGERSRLADYASEAL